MKDFIEEHEREVLLILLTMVAIARWWVPSVTGFENIYAVSHWVLSYDHGLVRRGLVGTVVGFWMPIVSVKAVHDIALVAYCLFLLSLAVVFYFLLRYKDQAGRLFRVILLFAAAPATLALCARDLGRFDLFQIMILLLTLTLLSRKKLLWLIPILGMLGMFIHEAFLLLCAPTIIAAIIFVYVWDGRENSILAVLVGSVISIAGSFYVLYRFGNPTLGYEEFSHLIQSRASFSMTDLSMRECYFSLKDHVNLASPYLRDPGSILNYLGALLILSPVILVLLNLWAHAYRSCAGHRGACGLFSLATLSGLMVLPIATDFGRWLSAVIFCNFFAVFFLISRDVIKVGDLDEYTGGPLPLLFVCIILTFLLFGPIHDWNPYPYQDHVLYSAFSMMSVLLFDIGFCARWRSHNRAISGGGSRSAH